MLQLTIPHAATKIPYTTIIKISYDTVKIPQATTKIPHAATKIPHTAHISQYHNQKIPHATTKVLACCIKILHATTKKISHSETKISCVPQIKWFPIMQLKILPATTKDPHATTISHATIKKIPQLQQISCMPQLKRSLIQQPKISHVLQLKDPACHEWGGVPALT